MSIVHVRTPSEKIRTGHHVNYFSPADACLHFTEEKAKRIQETKSMMFFLLPPPNDLRCKTLVLRFYMLDRVEIKIRFLQILIDPILRIKHL